MNLLTWLDRQRRFSIKTFGPEKRKEGILSHIEKEIEEVRQADPPKDLEEWIDIAILAFDGAWRAGYSSNEIASALQEKQKKFETRKYPDWRNFSEDEAIEHIREEE